MGDPTTRGTERKRRIEPCVRSLARSVCARHFRFSNRRPYPLRTRMHFRARTRRTVGWARTRARTNDFAFLRDGACNSLATTHLATDGLRLNISSAPKESFLPSLPRMPSAILQAIPRGSLKEVCSERDLPAALRDNSLLPSLKR